MASVEYRLSTGERWDIAPDDAGVRITGELEPTGIDLVLTWSDIALLQGLLALLAGQAAVKEVS